MPWAELTINGLKSLIYDGTSHMVDAKTEVATRINEIESHAHLIHYHGHAFETIKAVKIMRITLAHIIGRSEGHCCKAF